MKIFRYGSSMCPTHHINQQSSTVPIAEKVGPSVIVCLAEPCMYTEKQSSDQKKKKKTPHHPF